MSRLRNLDYTTAVVWSNRWMNHPRPRTLMAQEIGREVGYYLDMWMEYDPGCDDGFVVKIRRAPAVGDYEEWFIERVDNENQ